MKGCYFNFVIICNVFHMFRLCILLSVKINEKKIVQEKYHNNIFYLLLLINYSLFIILIK